MFKQFIYILILDGHVKYARTALNTLLKELKGKGYILHSITTVKKHLKEKQYYENGSVRIIETGLFSTPYDSSK